MNFKPKIKAGELKDTVLRKRFSLNAHEDKT